MGLTNNMPPFSLSAHHFVQKGERLLLLDHTLMDVLIIHSILVHLFYSAAFPHITPCYFILNHFIHSFLFQDILIKSQMVSSPFQAFTSRVFHFPSFLCSSLSFKDNAPYIHCTTFSFQIWIHLPQIHLFQHDSFYVYRIHFFVLLLNIAIPHLSF